MDSIEINPASLTQVMQTRKGGMLLVDDDVQNVAQSLRDIDPSLRLRFDPHADYFCVYQVVEEPDGSESEKMVTTAQDLDHRIVHRVREVVSPRYDFMAELDKQDAAAAKAKDDEQTERYGDIADKLAWALRKDLGPV